MAHKLLTVNPAAILLLYPGHTMEYYHPVSAAGIMLRKLKDTAGTHKSANRSLQFHAY
jgi:hypothetical protein